MKNDPYSLSYVLITPARNEAAFIEKTILSVISQTVLPQKWIVVSDGSTDQTDEIVSKYLPENPWMELVKRPERKGRNFAAKVHCFNAGYERVKGMEYDIIGNLDADVSFDADYIEFLLGKFSQLPSLGVAGTRYIENDVKDTTYSYKDVSGQCQLFRRECFEEIGGYIPIKYGGIDNVAVISARMKGWDTITFDDKTFFHYRPMGTANRNKLTAMMHFGREDYLRGNHPLWELFRVTFQMMRTPYLIGGLSLLIGYAGAFIGRIQSPIPEEVINFHRTEQLQRLKTILKGLIKFQFSIKET